MQDPQKIRKHSFHPLLRFEKKWRRAPLKNRKGGVEYRTPKIRPISYACRKDAYIYKHYRTILSSFYEETLKHSQLDTSILAYRKVLLQKGSESCKSNINFANDAFKIIDELAKCCVVAIDISDYFGSINHLKLKQVWINLLGTSKLPDDHFAVFKSITNYRYVDKTEAYIALGYSEYDAKKRPRYLIKPSKIPTQICSPAEYRKKIVNGGLVRKNNKNYGIPQGTPISDLLANAYLFDFDLNLKKYAKKRGGYYFRYSDDILLIIPGDGRTARGIISIINKEIKKHDKQLDINTNKTEIVCFSKKNKKFRCYSPPILKSKKTKSLNEGLSYLGFRYDGSNVFLRNSTLTNLRGKISRACKAVAYQHINKHREKDIAWLVKNIPIEQLKQRYLRVDHFEETVKEAIVNGHSPFTKMTFWSYAKKSEAVFDNRGKLIMKQLRNIEPTIKRLLEHEIRKKYK